MIAKFFGKFIDLSRVVAISEISNFQRVSIWDYGSPICRVYVQLLEKPIELYCNESHTQEENQIQYDLLIDTWKLAAAAAPPVVHVTGR